MEKFAEGIDEFIKHGRKEHVGSKVKESLILQQKQLKGSFKVFNRVEFWIPGFQTDINAFIIILALNTSVFISF